MPGKNIRMISNVTQPVARVLDCTAKCPLLDRPSRLPNLKITSCLIRHLVLLVFESETLSVNRF